SAVLASFGAVVVCLGLAIVGVVVFLGTSLASIGRGLRSMVGRLHGGADRPEDVDATHHTDQIVDLREPLPEPEPEPEPDAVEIDEPKQVRLPVRPRAGGYTLPPLDLLRRAPASAGDARDEQHTRAALERTFNTFGVGASVVASHRGPTVTMYEIEVEAGTKVNKVLNLSEDIAYALATPDVRIIAPIPGKSAIGAEVPNKVRDFVMLGDVLSSKSAQDSTKPLHVALGKDVHGRAVLVNLAEMPHLLIAGA